MPLIPRDQVFRQATRGEEFLWPADLRPADYSGFRTLLPDGERPRDASDLPLEEVGNAVLHLLEHNLSAPRSELVLRDGTPLRLRPRGCERRRPEWSSRSTPWRNAAPWRRMVTP
jgi:hypothetical protein